jgi:hypothetical protein
MHATKQTAILEPLPGVQLLLAVDYATTAGGGHTVTAAATVSGVEVCAVMHTQVLHYLKTLVRSANYVIFSQ